MLGVLCFGEGKIRAEPREILGLPVLWATVPKGGVLEKHRIARAERILRRHGVRYLLPTRAALGQRVSIPAVDPLGLYRTLADRLVLEVLKGRDVAAQYATVVLAGDRVDGDLARTAYLLCPKIRALLLEVGSGGERLAMELYREFGVAIRTEGQADLRVRFSGAAQAGELVLCGQAELPGLQVELPGLCLPEELEQMPVLTALWQTGRIDVKELCLRYIPEDCACEKGVNML